MPCGRVFTGLCGTADLEISREVREVDRDRCDDRSTRPCRLWLCEGAGVGEGDGNKSAGGEASGSALDAQAVLRKERADPEPQLEGMAVAVLTALGERDHLVRDLGRRH
jgi:hypothetical protein